MGHPSMGFRTNASAGDGPAPAMVMASPNTKETFSMVILVAIPLICLAALVVDTVRTASRVGGFPTVEFTHRAYGA